MLGDWEKTEGFVPLRQSSTDKTEREEEKKKRGGEGIVHQRPFDVFRLRKGKRAATLGGKKSDPFFHGAEWGGQKGSEALNS